MARFERGASGNPKGRKVGSRPRALAMLDKIGQDNAADVVRAVIERAKNGDAAMASLLLARCWPPRRGRPIRFAMPRLSTAADLPGALAAVVTAVSEGVLSPDEAASVAIVLNAQMRAVEIVELDRRMKEIERRQANAAEGPP
jgi:hypothetical protein